MRLGIGIGRAGRGGRIGNFALSPGNLQTFPDQFDDAAWSKTAVTVSANASAAPDGGVTADTMVPSVDNTAHFVAGAAVAFTSGAAYTFSLYVKSAGYRWARVFLPSAAFAASGRAASFDVVDGVAGTVQSGVTASISPAGSGWYRLSVSAVAAASASGGAGINVHASDSAAAAAMAGDGVSGLHLWRAQLVTGAG